MAHLLIIDDDQQIVTLLRTYLEQEGHAVISARDGSEGLKILAGTCFDIVITDIIMPECDGYEVLMSTRNMLSRPKLIVMSGGSANLRQESLLEISKNLKADAVLPKPIKLVELSAIIRELLSVGKT